MIGRFRAMGMPLAEVLVTPFHALRDFEREWWNLERLKNGQSPESDAPAGSALDERSLFYGYGMSLGAPLAVVEREWDRQQQEGSWGKLPGAGNRG